MEATVQLPEPLARQLSRLAQEEGRTLDGLISFLVSEHVERRSVLSAQGAPRRKDVVFPLIESEATGLIKPVSGAEIDEIFAADALTS